MSGFKKLAERLADLKDVPARAAKGASKRVADLITREFRAGQDPYGIAWQSLKPATIAKGRHAPPLYETGDMFRSVKVAPAQGSGIKITIGSDYAQYHQTGTGVMAARPILPYGSELPESWRNAIDLSVQEAFASGKKAA